MVIQDQQSNDVSRYQNHYLERDERVQVAYRELNDLLEVLEETTLQEEPAGPVTTLSIDDAEVTCWLVNIAGKVNLERVSALCQSLTGWSNVIDTRIDDISSGTVTLRLVTRGGIEMEPLSQAIRSLRVARPNASTAEFDLMLDAPLADPPSAA